MAGGYLVLDEKGGDFGVSIVDGVVLHFED